ncbi:MAG: TPM domain-containing protein [Rubrivivax sp.]
MLALAWLLLLAPSGVHAQQPQPVPALTARVIDQTGTLAPDRVAALEAKLAAFETEVGSQIVVLMVPTTAPEDIAAYAQRVGAEWKIGRRDVGDGLLMVIAKNDRRVNIQTARALEGAVPDLAARQIIDRSIVPAFRADDYAGGIDAALDQLFARVRGEALPEPADPQGNRGGQGSGQGLLMFFFIAVPVLGGMLTKLFGRKLGSLATAGAAGTVGWWLTASLLLGAGVALVALLLVGLFGIGSAARGVGRGGRGGGPPIIFGGGGDHGSWGGGGWGGGGGFGSGGGGSFGGGGASGSW